MAHAYVVTGSREEAIDKARGFAARHFASTGTSEPDILELSFGLLSVDDTHKISEALYQSAIGSQKVVIVYASRLFHEAQNALLKAVEEPSEGTIFILGVPTHGVLLSTLRSRLSTFADGEDRAQSVELQAAQAFITLNPTEREKYIHKLIERSKADADAIKQEARSEATELVKGLIEVTYPQFHALPEGKGRQEYRAFLEDLSAFLPRMYERSAPLKLIFEHIARVIPTSLGKSKV